MENEQQSQKCIICNWYFEGFGNNPDPVRDPDLGRACDDCNALVVIPMRLRRMSVPKTTLPGESAWKIK